jgi:hypothetical protein
MKNYIKRFLAWCKTGLTSLTFMAFAVCSGCNNGAGSNPIQPPVEAQGELLSPLKIAVMQDQTQSVNWTRTPQLSADDFELLRQVFHRQGGEIAFGLIRDHSNRGLVRQRFPAPIAKPTVAPEKDDIFEDAAAADAYQKSLDKWGADCKGRDDQIDLLFDQFLAKIKPLLEKQADARRTDVWGAIKRGDLFLSESDSDWPQPPHRYLILVTDGMDNQSKSPVSLKSGAKVMLVNGSATAGSLTGLKPFKFESVKAAVHEVAASEGVAKWQP